MIHKPREVVRAFFNERYEDDVEDDEDDTKKREIGKFDITETTRPMRKFACSR